MGTGGTPDSGIPARRLGAELASLRHQAGWSQEALASAVAYGRSTVATAERGHRLPAEEFWQRCDAALGAGGRLVAGYAGLRETRRLRSERQPSGSDTTSRGRRLGWADVQRLRAVVTQRAAAENTEGGGAATAATAVVLRRWRASVVEATATQPVRRALLQAVGNLAAVTAWSAYDAGNHDLARRCWHESLRHADEAGDWELRSHTYADLARASTTMGDLDAALTYAELAAVRSDRLSATGRAVLGAVTAQVLALRRASTAALAAIERADEEFQNRNSEADPAWLVYYDDAEHSGSTARAFAVVGGRAAAQAVQRYGAAVRLQDPRYPRSRVFSRLRLAAWHMSYGDPHEGAEQARRGIEEGAEIRSRRLRDEMRVVGAAAARHPSIAEVTEVGAALVAAARP